MPADERAAVVLALVQNLLAEVHPHARGEVTLDSRLDDLGIGSLELAELLLRVQKAFAVELPVDILRSAETPRDLVRALDRGRALPVEGLRAEPPPATMAAPEAPTAATTLTEALEWHARATPDRIHIRILDEWSRVEELTCAALYRAAPVSPRASP